MTDVAGTHLSILLVDDGSEPVQELRQELSVVHHVEVAAPHEALKRVIQTAWDLVVLGKNFDTEDCLKVALELRRRTPMAKLAIMCSNRIAPAERNRLRLGADLFLVSPWTDDSLDELLGQCHLAMHDDRPRVLLVDDDAVSLSLLVHAMPPGFDITTSRSPVEAYQLIKTLKPDILLTDYLMEEMDGTELIRAAKRALPTLRTILVTAYGNKDLAIKALQEGIDDLLEKPIAPVLLRKSVLQCWETVRLERERQRLLTDLQTLNIELTKAKESTEAVHNVIIEHAGMAIEVTDTEGRITYVNPAWTRYTDYSAEEAQGRTAKELLRSGRHKDAFYDAMWSTITAGKLWQGELLSKGKSGKLLPQLVTISPITDKGQTLTGFVTMRRDITDIKRTEQKLRLAKNAAEEAARVKSDFLAVMSHEIRTPMNGVIGMADVLKGTELSAFQRRCVETIESSGKTLMRLINDILDFSKIEAGKLELERIDFNVHYMIEDIVRLLEPRAKEKHIDLLSVVHSNVPRGVWGDVTRVRQVLLNLVGNAIKFTQKGKVVLRAKAKPQKGKTLIRFEVEDTGIGIEEEAVKNLFTPFMQADSSTTRKFGGTGLGLAISKRLVELMGGAIGVHSQIDRGSLFWFQVALEERPDPAEAAGMSWGQLKGLRVLSIDDNPTNRQVLERQLSAYGLLVESVEEGVSALERLRQAQQGNKPYHLVVLDLRMPHVDGLTLGRIIKSDPLFRELPLILITSSPEPGQASQAKRVGFSGYLTRPVEPGDLANCIRLVLSQPAKEEGRVITRHSLAEGKPKPRVLLIEDDELTQEVTVLMLESLECRVDVAGRGQDGLAALGVTLYDLVFLDCDLPDVSGLDVARQIRAQENGEKRLAIVALTGDVQEQNRKDCFAAGMDDFLAKPVVAEDLRRVLTAHIRRS